MSSAKSRTCECKNNKGPSTEPLGTPELTGISDELSPSSTTVWERPVRKAYIQDRVLPLAPCWWSLCNTSYDLLLKSSKIRSVCRSWEVLRASSSTSWMSWVSQDLLSQKPCWRSYRVSLWSKMSGQVWSYDVFHHFAENPCQWYGAVVNVITFISLFEDGGESHMPLVQSWGTWPESSYFWKNTERNRAISLLRFFKTMGLMESSPDALLGFRLQSSFMMPGTDIVISGIGWYLLCSESGTEWLPILPLSMPFCKTWMASWFNDRGLFWESLLKLQIRNISFVFTLSCVYAQWPIKFSESILLLSVILCVSRMWPRRPLPALHCLNKMKKHRLP